MDKPALYSQQIKQKALELDFLDCGIARADYLEKDADRLKTWLDNGYHGKMGYMENHFEKRTDPRKLVEGARSLIIVLQNYHTNQSQSDANAPIISKYAYGRDYHKIVRKKLNTLLAWMQNEYGPVSGRAFVDSAPIMERAWGRLAGLGWIGKHSLLLNRKYGSWFFIGVIICDLDLEADKPMKDYCGDCTRCIDSCPTQAILPGRSIDASRCISYLTIEYKKDEIPDEFRGKMNMRVFGCDICQDVCPWNNNAHPHQEDWLRARPGLLEMSRDDWAGLDEQKFTSIFKGSPAKRSKFKGLRRNIDFITQE
jgi:epoxyqueuosine reductase